MSIVDASPDAASDLPLHGRNGPGSLPPPHAPACAHPLPQLGQQALHIAALWGSVEAMEALIDAGAQVNAQNSQ